MGYGHEDVSHNNAGRIAPGFQSKTETQGVLITQRMILWQWWQGHKASPPQTHFKICLCLPFNIVLAGSSSIPHPEVTEQGNLQPSAKRASRHKEKVCTHSQVGDLTDTGTHPEHNSCFIKNPKPQRSQGTLPSLHPTESRTRAYQYSFPITLRTGLCSSSVWLEFRSKDKKYCPHPWWRWYLSVFIHHGTTTAQEVNLRGSAAHCGLTHLHLINTFFSS